jgi:hypothetical protein
MNIEFDFPEPDRKSTLQGAITGIKEDVEKFNSNSIDTAALLHGVMSTWGDIYAVPELRTKIERGFREKRLKMRTYFEMDMSKGDPIRKRYDPTLWMRNVPPELKSNPSLYILDKCKSLLTFLESLDGQK